MINSIQTVTERDLVGRWTAREKKIVLFDFDVAEDLTAVLTDRVKAHVVAEGRISLKEGSKNTKTINVGKDFSISLFQFFNDAEIFLYIDGRGVNFKRWFK